MRREKKEGQEKGLDRNLRCLVFFSSSYIPGDHGCSGYPHPYQNSPDESFQNSSPRYGGNSCWTEFPHKNHINEEKVS